MKIRRILFTVTVLVGSCFGQANGVPFGIIGRTFYVNTGQHTGTAFAIDYKGKQYLVTAKHVIEGLPATDATIKLFRTAAWREIVVDVLKPANSEVDIAVLVLRAPVTDPTNAQFGELTMEAISLGGQVYFLGYPHGLHSLAGTEYIPFVKAGVLSAIDSSDPTAIVLYVDGFNNEGFSGGPVVFFDNARNKWKIAGVIQGFLSESAKVRIGRENVSTNTLVNSGILVAFDISHALETIDRQLKK